MAICKKVGYESHKSAREALASCREERKQGDKTRKENRVYLCQYCGKYHLTSENIHQRQAKSRSRVVVMAKRAVASLKRRRDWGLTFEKIPKRKRKLE